MHVRPRLYHPLHGHRYREDGGRRGRRLHPHHRQEDLRHFQDILPILEQLVQSGKKLVIIAEDVEGEALSTLIVNRLRGTLNVRVRQGARLRRSPQGDAAGYRHPDRRPGHLRGAWLRAQGARPSICSAVRVRSRSPRRTPPSWTAPATSRPSRTASSQIRAQIDVTTSDYDKEKLQERLAKLAGGVAVIKVGAATETEMKEKKLRIEDALNATRAAVEEGIVAGGGTAYVNAVPAVEKLIGKVEGDEKTGVKIVVNALQEPDPPDRRERRRGRQRGAREDQEQPQGRLRLRRLQGGLLRHDRRRYRRSRPRSPVPRWRTPRPSAPWC